MSKVSSIQETCKQCNTQNQFMTVCKGDPNKARNNCKFEGLVSEKVNVVMATQVESLDDSLSNLWIQNGKILGRVLIKVTVSAAHQSIAFKVDIDARYSTLTYLKEIHKPRSTAFFEVTTAA